MAHRTVQLIVGQILTDEEFRSDFLDRPIETLASLRERGFELTNVEVDALARPIAASGRLVRSGSMGAFSAVDSSAENGSDLGPGESDSSTSAGI